MTWFTVLPLIVQMSIVGVILVAIVLFGVFLLRGGKIKVSKEGLEAEGDDDDKPAEQKPV